MAIPVLRGEALSAVRHRGSHLQIIASAGSGKTEVVAQRVADLFSEGIPPSALVAFTFTERAADELKHRIEQRVEARLGKDFVGKLNGCFIGTIHSHCFRLLQQHIAVYETYDVLDDNRLAAFLTRISNGIGLKDLNGALFRSLKAFIRNIDVVDNELIAHDKLQEPFRTVAKGFVDELARYRFLTHGQVIARAVQELKNPEVFRAVHDQLRHLIVDEYQDINPAQEELIRLLASKPVELCVVGDDDQSIYQWRGSDVGNIINFKERYAPVATFKIVKNRRSRPTIVTAAREFSRRIEGRLPKEMEAVRDGTENELVVWRAETEALEAEQIARTVTQTAEEGFSYADIAILVRSSAAYGKLLDAFRQHGVPVQPGGRTGLFMQPDAQLFGQTFSYFVDSGWRAEEYGQPAPVTLESLIAQYKHLYRLTDAAANRVRARLKNWKAEVKAASQPANLIRDYYDLLADCGIANWDFADPNTVARLGALARCSAILADYESVRRRSRPAASGAGEAVGGQDRGEWYYRWLAIHIQNWALGAFEDFEGEDDFTLNAVDVLTVHKAKGLEWPIVFVPSLSQKRFPSSKTGSSQEWHVPTRLFDRVRYEGTLNDERRLFYVAMTRARDWLSLSTHDTPNKQRVAPSPFICDVAGEVPKYPGKGLPVPPAPAQKEEESRLLSITFSELSEFGSCGLAYRLRALIGFQPPLAPELGYGKAVHHVLRNVAEHTRRHRKPPSPDQLQLIFDTDFYLPAANKPAHQQMKAAARRLVDNYVAKYGDEMKRVWAVERPFELHLENAVISGRADVILEENEGGTTNLAIVDYKTATDDDVEYEHQLQIYTDAGRREGLQVRAAFVHDLKAGDRIAVDVTPQRVEQAEARTINLVERLKARQFTPNPGARCTTCDVKAICRHAA